VIPIATPEPRDDKTPLDVLADFAPAICDTLAGAVRLAAMIGALARGSRRRRRRPRDGARP